MSEDLFNPSQQITAKLFYNLIAQLNDEQRIGAVRALSALIPATEDSFLSVNGVLPRTDFFVQCFDVLVAVALSLKMLEDDGVIPQDIPEIIPQQLAERVAEADLALKRVERILSLSPRPNALEH